MLKQLQQCLQDQADPARAEISARFFKTGPGEYAEGEQFLGIRVPVLRGLIKSYLQLNFTDLSQLISSPYNEARLTALFILIEQYKCAGTALDKKRIYQFYVNNMRFVNNWDRVDASAAHIVGAYLYDKDRAILSRWAKNNNMWYRRIAVVATFYFIRHNDFKDTLQLAEMLLSDTHDLIHKAVGWMLREVGKRDQALLEDFIMRHYTDLPRTTLRYAIERFTERKRKRFLTLKRVM